MSGNTPMRCWCWFRILRLQQTFYFKTPGVISVFFQRNVFLEIECQALQALKKKKIRGHRATQHLSDLCLSTVSLLVRSALPFGNWERKPSILEIILRGKQSSVSDSKVCDFIKASTHSNTSSWHFQAGTLIQCWKLWMDRIHSGQGKDSSLG